MLPKFKKILVIPSTVRRTITELQLEDKIKLRIIDEKNNYTSDKGIYTDSSQHQTYKFLKAKNEAILQQLSNI